MKILLSTLHSRYTQATLALPALYANLPGNVEAEIAEYNINQSIDDILRDIKAEQYHIIGFSCYIWNLEQTLKLCGKLKAVNPELIIVLGGPEVSYNPEEILKLYSFIDYIVSGEGEMVFKQFLLNLNSFEKLKYIKGLNGQKKGEIFLNSPAVVEDLNSINLPYKYLNLLEEKKFYYFESSRGCPYKCSYCLSSLTGKVRFLDLDKVKENLLFLINQNLETIRFIDRTFNINEERAQNIMKFIIENKNPSQMFQLEIKGDLISKSFLTFINNLPENTFQFEIGIQSVSDKVLKTLERRESFNKLFENIQSICNRGNIHTHLDLIIGLPGETLESFKKAINISRKLNPDTLQANTLKVLRGSGLHINMEKEGLTASPFVPYEILRTKDMSFDEINQAEKVSKIINLFYNSALFKKTLQFIDEKEDFYNLCFRLKEYFEKNSIKFHSLSQKKAFLVLKDFLREEFKKEDFFILKNLLKLDFILTNKDYKNNFYPLNKKEKKKKKAKDKKISERKIAMKTRFKTGPLLKRIEFEYLPTEYKNLNADNEGYYYYYFNKEKNHNVFLTDKLQIDTVKLMSNKKTLSFEEIIKNLKVDKSKIKNIIELLINKEIIVFI
ncbi:MAG: DUF4080 domain-containing protein [Candidatus Muiribacteriota bacterium]